MTSQPFITGVFLSLDGTDCHIFEPKPFSPVWFSHKFRGPGLRYEVGISVHMGRIVWVNGPFACGGYPDLKIFKANLLHRLGPTERILADNGYRHPKCLTPDIDMGDFEKEVHMRQRARHETVNKRLKNFNVLSHVFRHELFLHSKCFHAVAQVVALLVSTSDPLFGLQ